MARTIGEVNLAAELWTPAVQQRFETLFSVAGRKSLSGWRQTPRQAAEVLVIEGFAPVEFKDGASVPCVVYVGGEAALQPLGRSAQGWAAHLDVDFTLSDLIDILDRAAVFLMDWRARQKASVTLTLQRALEDLKHQGLECPHRFQLKSWIALPMGANTAQNMRVLALLSRGLLMPGHWQSTPASSCRNWWHCCLCRSFRQRFNAVCVRSRCRRR